MNPLITTPQQAEVYREALRLWDQEQYKPPVLDEAALAEYNKIEPPDESMRGRGNL